MRSTGRYVLQTCPPLGWLHPFPTLCSHPQGRGLGSQKLGDGDRTCLVLLACLQGCVSSWGLKALF